MLFRAVVIAALAVTAFATEEPAPAEPAPAEPTTEGPPADEEPIPVEDVEPVVAGGIDAAIAGVVQGEEMLARTYLELILKVQAAYYNKRAAVATIQMFLAKNKDMAAAAPAAITGAAPADPTIPASLEEENDEDASSHFGPASDFELEEDEDEDDGEGDDDVSFLELESGARGNAALARIWLDLFTAIKVNLYQSVYAASDLQKEFFLNRGLQLKVASFGDAIPKEYVNLLYIQVFKTYLSTQKLSKKFEMVSTWTTWLEDELDLVRANAGDVGSGGSSNAEIATDRLYAFKAFSNVAYLDLSEFMIASYLEYQQGVLAGAAVEAATGGAGSFLEVEANTNSKSKFVPTMLQAAGQTYYATKLYKMYSLYYAYAAAEAGLQSASIKFSQVSGKGVTSKLPNAAKYSDSLFSLGFASNIMYACDVDMVTAMWSIYNIVAPMFSQQEANAKAALHM